VLRHQHLCTGPAFGAQPQPSLTLYFLHALSIRFDLRDDLLLGAFRVTIVNSTRIHGANRAVNRGRRHALPMLTKQSTLHFLEFLIISTALCQQCLQHPILRSSIHRGWLDDSGATDRVVLCAALCRSVEGRGMRHLPTLFYVHTSPQHLLQAAHLAQSHRHCLANRPRLHPRQLVQERRCFQIPVA
jgi:hypothetical protein